MDSGPGRPLAGHTKLCILLTWLIPNLSSFGAVSLEDLRAFPLTARREAGHQLDQVQNGREPDDWKPTNTVGRGAKEIRIRDEAGAFRVLYLAKFADAVYVLHCSRRRPRKPARRTWRLPPGVTASC